MPPHRGVLILESTTYHMTHSSLRVVFFGMLGRFSLIHLEALLAAEIDVRAVVVAADTGPTVALLRPPPAPPIPLHLGERANNIVGLAWERGIPVYAVRRFAAAETRAVLAELQPDVACVACFARRIPPALLALPRYGFLNVHPSLLPAHRGPTPLFWVLREDRRHAGVTIHQMDDSLDTGPILLQEPIALPTGISGPEADRLCGQLGARLLLHTLDRLARGEQQPTPQLVEGNADPAPSPADFWLDPTWSAERAFAFMRGTAEWDYPYPIRIGDATLLLTYAIEYDADAHLDEPLRYDSDSVVIQFNPGVLRARARSRRL